MSQIESGVHTLCKYADVRKQNDIVTDESIVVTSSCLNPDVAMLYSVSNPKVMTMILNPGCQMDAGEFLDQIMTYNYTSLSLDEKKYFFSEIGAIEQPNGSWLLGLDRNGNPKLNIDLPMVAPFDTTFIFDINGQIKLNVPGTRDANGVPVNTQIEMFAESSVIMPESTPTPPVIPTSFEIPATTEVFVLPPVTTTPSLVPDTNQNLDVQPNLWTEPTYTQTSEAISGMPTTNSDTRVLPPGLQFVGACIGFVAAIGVVGAMMSVIGRESKLSKQKQRPKTKVHTPDMQSAMGQFQPSEVVTTNSTAKVADKPVSNNPAVGSSGWDTPELKNMRDLHKFNIGLGVKGVDGLMPDQLEADVAALKQQGVKLDKTRLTLLREIADGNANALKRAAKMHEEHGTTNGTSLADIFSWLITPRGDSAVTYHDTLEQGDSPNTIVLRPDEISDVDE